MVLRPLLPHGTLPDNSSQQLTIDGVKESAIIQWLNYRGQLWRIGEVRKRGTYQQPRRAL